MLSPENVREIAFYPDKTLHLLRRQDPTLIRDNFSALLFIGDFKGSSEYLSPPRLRLKDGQSESGIFFEHM